MSDDFRNIVVLRNRIEKLERNEAYTLRCLDKIADILLKQTTKIAAVAQMAEHLPCKQDVGSSNLSSGSKLKFTVPTTSWGQSVTSVWSGDAPV